MFSMDSVIKFLSKSGMRKIGTALYYETFFCWLLKVGVLPAEQFVELTQLLIICVFVGNAAEHYVKNMTPKKDEPVKPQ